MKINRKNNQRRVLSSLSALTKIVIASVLVLMSAMIFRNVFLMPIRVELEYSRLVFFLTGIALYAALMCVANGSKTAVFKKKVSSNSMWPLVLLYLARLVTPQIFLVALGFAYGVAFRGAFLKSKSENMGSVAFSWGLMLLVLSCLVSKILVDQFIPNSAMDHSSFFALSES